MAHIDYYLFPLSPFTYLAGDRLERIAAQHGASVTYKPFDLIAAFARTGGTPLPERPKARLDYRAQDLMRTARALGMPFNLSPAHVPTNPAPAAFAIIAAQKAGGGDVGALVRAILAAAWAEEKNIADDGVIRACLDSAGFDPALADTGLFTGAEVYERTLEEAVAALGSALFALERAPDVPPREGLSRANGIAVYLARLVAPDNPMREALVQFYGGLAEVIARNMITPNRDEIARVRGDFEDLLAAVS